MNVPAASKLAVLIAAVGLLLLIVLVIKMTALCPWASRRLLQWGARHCSATETLRERFEEEWLADLEEVPGNLAKLAHCLGVLLFTAVPLWARSRWERSRLVGWLKQVTTRLRPTPA